MEFKLEEQEKNDIQNYIANVVKDAINRGSNSNRPYLNRKDIAEYLGVAPTTIDIWVSLGMPVAVIDGRKLYGKKSCTDWLKSMEQTKKPPTIHIVEDIQKQN